ncbi:MAG: DUF5678 domain-containing protein [Blastocatellia bacterium]
MSTITFDQLRAQLLRLPPDIIQMLRAALQFDTQDLQRLLDELPAEQSPQPREVTVRKVEARDYSRELDWLRENAHLYPGQHLAVCGDQLLEHGTDPGEVFDRAKATGQRFLMHRVPPEGEIWGGGGW